MRDDRRLSRRSYEAARRASRVRVMCAPRYDVITPKSALPRRHAADVDNMMPPLRQRLLMSDTLIPLRTAPP